jgi:hypothetical protein
MLGRLLWLTPGGLVLGGSGCDTGAEITFAALNLAAAIVAAAV